jgi:DNA polymerase III psi subunit
MTEPIQPPNALADAGKALWLEVTGKYALRVDELRTLEDACAATDMIAALTSVWVDEGRPVTTKGSMGQQVIHPLIGEIRTQRVARNALWKQLKLPDIDGDAGQLNQNRDAANASWQPGVRGRGA